MDTAKFRTLFPSILTSGSLNESILDSYFSDTRKYSHHGISENEIGWDIEMPLPGVSKKDLKISIKENDKLFIEVSKESKWSKGLTKIFELTTSCDPEKISAELTDGILLLNIPKKKSFRDRVLDLK